MSNVNSINSLFAEVDALSSQIENLSTDISSAMSTPRGRETRKHIIASCNELRLRFYKIIDAVGALSETNTSENEKLELKKVVSFLRTVEKEMDRIEVNSKTIRSFRVFSCFQHKGGVSKTSSNFVLATMLGTHYDKKVLIIDLDTQGNISNLLDPTFKLQRTGIKKLFEYGFELEDVIESTQFTGVDLITNSIVNDEVHYHLEQNKGSGASFVLRKILKEHTEYLNEKYDYIILDFAPNLYSQLNRNGFFAVDTFIYMTKPETESTSFSIDGIINFEMFYKKSLFKDNLDKEQKFCVLRNMIVPKEKITRKFLAQLEKTEFLNATVLNTMIEKTTKFEQVLGSGKVLGASNDAIENRLYEQYSDLIKELMVKDYI